MTLRLPNLKEGYVNALEWMPPMESIPQEFKTGDQNFWRRVARSWFYNGLPSNVTFDVKDGIDRDWAFEVITATLSSFAPRHQHKIASVAYMLSEWFEDVDNWQKAPEDAEA